jgi:peptidoglycan hydrolase-like protein with peptidoglycan-binding domain
MVAISAAVLCLLAVAGIVTALLLALASDGAFDRPDRPAPAAAVETVQRELAELNYYHGPINGDMTTSTTAAIGDLQRQAGLSPSGRMNPATESALISRLEHRTRS